MALVVAVCRYLWLCNWVADVFSKSQLSKLPFKSKLFREELDRFVKDLGESKGASTTQVRSSALAWGQVHDFRRFCIMHFAPY